MKKEVWKEIVGWDGIYRVSNLGRIKSIFHRKRGIVVKIRRFTLNKGTGYLQCTLFISGHPRINADVHVLVATAFKKKKLSEVNHKNGIKTDNRTVNLEWTTKSGNMKHAHKMGLISVRTGGDCLTSRRVGKRLDGKIIQEYETMEEAKKEGFSKSGIYQSIKQGWKHRGFDWVYLDQPRWTRRIIFKKRPIIGVSKSNHIKKYDSVNDAAKDGYEKGNMYKALKNQNSTVGGYVWKYAN